MNLKRFLLALIAVALFAIVVTDSASATMTAQGEWYIGATAPGTTLAEGTSKSVSCSIGAHNGESKIVLAGSIGESPGTPVKLTATGVECIEATIFNQGGHGKDSGRLKFTGVTVSEPTGCDVLNDTITTEPLKTELYMDSASTTAAFDKFEAATAGGNFAIVHITGTCAAAGTKTIKGFIFGEAVNPTSTPAVTQPLTFSPAIDSTTGGGLTLAGNAASLTGRINTVLLTGESFLAH